MEGITHINAYNKAVRECNKYGEIFGKKYWIDINEQVYKDGIIIFRPPCGIQYNS
jgi:hypothetical protein